MVVKLLIVASLLLTLVLFCIAFAGIKFYTLFNETQGQDTAKEGAWLKLTTVLIMIIIIGLSISALFLL